MCCLRFGLFNICVKKRRYHVHFIVPGRFCFTSVLVIDAVLMGAFFGKDQLQQRFEQLNVGEDGRLFLSQRTLQMLESDWLTGIGAGAFYSVYPQFRDHRIGSYFDHVHNDLLQFPAELGVIAAGLLGVLPIFMPNAVTMKWRNGMSQGPTSHHGSTPTMRLTSQKSPLPGHLRYAPVGTIPGPSWPMLNGCCARKMPSFC
ncbi:MAG TPA: O-antigen ligase domain-containing protein [Gammaproteobacteria bacterium]|nr:O-antigen ligase domain-containing protein [Gammaproteobacteria bacterium]